MKENRDYSLVAYQMIEEANRSLKEVVVEDERVNPSLTLDENNILKEVDGPEALKQSIRRALTTERFSNPNYDHRYGVELFDLFGSDMDYVAVEIERRITESLQEDDRIYSIHSFETEADKEILNVTFQIETAFGSIEIEGGFLVA